MGGTTQAGAERSTASHNRTFRGMFAFQDYFMRRASQAIDIAKHFKEATEDGNHRGQAEASKMAARYLMGSAAAGTAATAILSAWKGGFEGVLQYALEAWEDPWFALSEAVQTSTFGGAGGSLLKATQEGRSMLDSLVYGVTPWQSVGEIFDVIGLSYALGESGLPFTAALRDGISGRGGQAKYKHLSPIERVWEYAKGFTPVGKDLERGLFGLKMFGLVESDPDLRRAIPRYYKWRRRYAPLTELEMSGAEGRENYQAFHKDMKRAKNLIRKGLKPYDGKVLKELMKAATSVGGKEPVASSLLGMRIMKGRSWAQLNQEQKQDLRKWLGSDYNIILFYDKYLEEVSKAIRR
tara:strand:- start:143 stop:1198 length:1056 start_codon:yes stop_codon:yes gene_type:complete